MKINGVANNELNFARSTYLTRKKSSDSSHLKLLDGITNIFHVVGVFNGPRYYNQQLLVFSKLLIDLNLHLDH